ncbi:hypothetical protein ASE04_19360 [Rhizobium sp. Root708]|uniref:ChaN family lipoprotein n=1 Tax=Rhizobium sp. Root708 TaxID=1736592 RepID=UPI0006F6D129|nr:ChaN family lipoprotein [Rhizobium sp. Root708]KRB62043.1 hypothetical protein ASE04_19360 [Rhizobium sp. Root708]
MTSSVHSPGTWIAPATGALLPHGGLLRHMATKQAVLLGETHDRYDIHRWQLHVLAGLYAYNDNIVVGFEMFPRRCQPVLNEWVAGNLDAASFLDKVEWKSVWGFEPELYMPLFHFCRQFKVAMKALNCRRALVTEVGKLGWDAIPIEDRDGVSPAKPATDAHRQYLFNLTGGGRPDRKARSADDPEFDRFVRAQQTWDRAFACNIVEAHGAMSSPLVVGIIGRGHLEYGYGTPAQLADLGISDVAVLLPCDTPFVAGAADACIADAMFYIKPECEVE